MNKKLKWQSVNWSPYATNILDAGEFELCTVDGEPVDMHRDGMRFVLIVNGQRNETEDNLTMSFWMNRHGVGGVRK